jgi:hypothetical protein
MQHIEFVDFIVLNFKNGRAIIYEEFFEEKYHVMFELIYFVFDCFVQGQHQYQVFSLKFSI